VEVDGILTDSGRPTALKTRIVAHQQQVVRADYERRHPLDQAMQGQLLDWFARHWEGYDAVLLSDYNKGVFRPDTASRMLAELAGRRPAVAGPKPENFDLFRDARLVTLNARVAAAAAGQPTDSEANVKLAGSALRARLGGGSLLVTRGEHGMTLFAGPQPLTVPALASQVFDVSGAGDTVLATVGLALAAGGTDEEAIRLASHAAAVVVRKLGTATATPDEILAALP
jgi:D-beta-D-heptose 7-phosphate kinase/D-beta-D-heptose 1-phosphate adenosyltransferase